MFVSVLIVESWGRGSGTNLECAANAEDTVVGLLGRQTLDGLLDNLALLGDEIVEPRGELATEVDEKSPRATSG